MNEDHLSAAIGQWQRARRGEVTEPMEEILLLCGCRHDGYAWHYCPTDRPRTVLEDLAALALDAGLPPLEKD